VPLKDHDQLVAELREANVRLAKSLERCRSLLGEYRSKIAAPNPENDDSLFQWDDKIAP